MLLKITARSAPLILACQLLLLCIMPTGAYAAGGPLGIDSQLPLDTSGIWARKYQTGLESGVIAVEVVGALWFGNDDKLGHAFWQDIDSTALSGVAAQILKYGFSRARPSQSDNPNAFFKGHCCQSFPSGEVTLAGGVRYAPDRRLLQGHSLDLDTRGAAGL